jgi:hypothetical protein
MRILLWVLLLWGSSLGAAAQFSVGTDGMVMRNVDGRYAFYTFGQTIKTEYHGWQKINPFVSFGYYSPARYLRLFDATAKSPATNPQTSQFRVRTTLRLRHFTIGAKYYLRGS